MSVDSVSVVAAGLRRLPTRRELDHVVGRLEGGEVQVSEEGDRLPAVDPSANRVLFRVSS